MFNVEPAFPRGKKVPSFGLMNRVRKPKSFVKNYGAKVLPEEKMLRLRPKERRRVLLSEKATEETMAQLPLDAANLTLRTLQEGMLVLGCVKRIAKTIIELTLPGRLRGNVPISMISHAYSKRLQEMIDTGSTDCPTLNDLYSCGDLVYVKVVRKSLKPKVQVICSLNPKDLHDSYVLSQLVPGLVLSATIAQKEDHGYFMDLGVRNVRAFLPYEKLGKNRDDVGRNLLCSIESVTQFDARVTVFLKALDPDAPRVLNVEEADLQTIVPGCKLLFTVEEQVKFGLRGTIFDDMVPAYVNETMLTKVTSTPEKYSMFKKIPATLLYVIPATNQVFVSLRPYPNNRTDVGSSIAHGTVIEKAYVKAVDKLGVWFRLQNKHRGLLFRNVIMKQAALAGNVDESVVMGNFQIGTSYKVIVIHHDLLEDTYIVSNDPSIIDEEIRTRDDIVIGNKYKCRVTKSVDGGFHVAIGHLKGSVLNVYSACEHRDRVQINEVIEVRAVMLEVDSPFIKFTNHPELLDENASILHDWDQLDATRKDQSFDGIIFKHTFNKVLVRFFNDIVGEVHLPRSLLNQDVAQIANMRLRTVQKFTVLEFDKNTGKLLLTPTVVPKAKLQSAVICKATVTCVHAAGVDVRTEDGKTGTIPTECLSEFGEHNSLYMRLLQEGTTVTVVQTNPGTYSLRLIEYYNTHPMNVESVESGALLKGSCINVNGVPYVTPLLSNFSQQIEIATKENFRDVVDGSIMMMRVLKVNQSAKQGYELQMSTGMFDVCENGKHDVYNYTAEYLKDVSNLIQRYRDQNHAFARFTLGEYVECVVERVVPNSNKLTVEVHAIDKGYENVAKGIATIIMPRRPASSYAVGLRVPGRVVWIDVEQKLVHVCVDKPLVERILLSSTNELTKNPVVCCVLFANNYVQICCQQAGPPSPMVVVPVKCHYNDMVERENSTTQNLLVKLQWYTGDMIFAMSQNKLSFYEMCYKNWRAKKVDNKVSAQQERNNPPNSLMVRCRPSSETFDESFMEEEESENENDDDEPQRGEMATTSYDEEDADTTYDNMNEDGHEDNGYNKEESDDELTVPTPLTVGIGNGKKQKKGVVSKPLKNGHGKSKLKREIAAEAQETAAEEQLKKKKKKKSAPAEDPAADDDIKLPKMVAKKNKKSVLLIGNGAKKSKVAKKKSALVIDQLDGACDFFLQQLDGTEDSVIAPSDNQKMGATKRKRTADAKGLPGAINFWDSTPVYKRTTVSDSSDDEAHNSDGEQCEPVGKMRNSAKERFEAMKQEEERLRKLEDELANPSVDPHTPDQFDRLVLAQPNNSMLWIRYMAFHMESAELDKARAVGRKALKAIHFREETDRLNIWMALLNLEIRYETVDSFKEVLQEAVQYNDAFKVYARAIDILVDCQKHAEVQELLELLLKKFRKQNDMWFLVADAWYRIGQGGKVKPLLSQALKSLPEREHIPIIVKFAFLHNRNENRDEAHLLFEQILTSYPKRTDIWSQYIDMLVKDDLVGNARQILERAIMQRLPMKNMKTLYTKYVNFEEKHGDRDSVRRVKQLAADYVQAQLNNAGIK